LTNELNPNMATITDLQPEANLKAPILDVQGLRKAFGGVKALNGVSFTLLPGEVHALVGENGAGKSTLLKVLSGAFPADTGAITLAGEAYRPGNPHDAKAAGIQVVHQEFNLLPHMTVAENICIENFPRSRLGLLDRNAMRRKSNVALNAIGLDEIDVNKPVSTLGIAHRQLVEIARALQSHSRILILDEPTATLTERESQRLFAIIRSVKEKGVTIVFVSHHLNEVFEICDRVTVFRGGETITTQEISKTSPTEVVRNMVGRELAAEMIHANEDRSFGDVVLELQSLRTVQSPHERGVSFKLRASEIVGIAGLVGAGRTELLRAIFGAEPSKSGTILLDGVPILNQKPRNSIAAGIGFVTEDRKDEGLILDMPIAANMSLSNLKMVSAQGLLRFGLESKTAVEGGARLKLKYGKIGDKVSSLSGGNQQKVVLAKWLSRSPKILILDEPTRGVDVGAKAEIYGILRKLAADGVALLIVSSELPELMTLCDRVLVLANHQIRGEVLRRDFSQERILRLAYNQPSDHTEPNR
jgi:ribose transport system ATP-binding protein